MWIDAWQILFPVGGPSCVDLSFLLKQRPEEDFLAPAATGVVIRGMGILPLVLLPGSALPGSAL